MTVATQKKYYHQSEITAFLMCERRWWYEYVEGRKVAPSEDLAMGTCVDDATTFALLKKKETGELPGLPDVLVVLNESFAKIADDVDWYDMTPAEARDMGQALVEVWYAKAAANIKPAAVQAYLQVDLQGKTYGLAGTLDIIETDDMLRDTKTSGTKYQDDRVMTSNQAAMYSFLFRETYKRDPKGFTFDVLTKTKEKKYLPVTGIVSKRQIEQLLETVDIMHEHIQASLRPRPTTEYGWWCSRKGCPFWGICKEGK